MNQLANTGSLIRLVLRRDRIVLAIWIVFAALPPLGVAAGFAKLYPTADALRAFADECMSNPAIVAILGPVYAPTLGGMVAWRVGAMGMLATAIPSLLLVVRHTRSEDESGRLELIAATAVGRLAPLTAATIVTMAANLALGGIIAIGLVAMHLPVGGAIALGASWIFAGWIFVAIAANCAQVFTSARTADQIALVIFAIFFLMRTLGDSLGISSRLVWLSWLSPLGWTRLVRPFAVERWWLVGAGIALALVLLAVALAISAQRDLGGGLMPERGGPATATESLSGPFGLAWRLQRGMLFGWLLSFAIFGALLGAVARTLDAVVASPQLDGWLSQMGAQDPAHAFLRIIIYVLGQAIAAYTILATMNLRAEESAMRAEPVLATAVARTRWAASHIVFAIAGPAIALTVTGAAIGLQFGSTGSNIWHNLISMIAITTRTLPAVWVMAAVAMLAFGAKPRISGFITWIFFAASLILELAWELRQVGQGIFDISPFAYVHWTIASVSPAAMIGLITTAALLIAAGLAAFARRDLA